MYDGETIPLKQVGLPSSLRMVYASDEYVLPGLSEMILDVSVELDESEVNGFFVIEPTQNCVEPHPLMSVPLLVDSSTHVTMKAHQPMWVILCRKR